MNFARPAATAILCRPRVAAAKEASVRGPAFDYEILMVLAIIIQETCANLCAVIGKIFETQFCKMAKPPSPPAVLTLSLASALCSSSGPTRPNSFLEPGYFPVVLWMSKMALLYGVRFEDLVAPLFKFYWIRLPILPQKSFAPRFVPFWPACFPWSDGGGELP